MAIHSATPYGKWMEHYSFLFLFKLNWFKYMWRSSWLWLFLSGATATFITSKKHVTYVIMNVCVCILPILFFSWINQRLIAGLCLQNIACMYSRTFGWRVLPEARDWTSKRVNAFNQTGHCCFPSTFSLSLLFSFISSHRRDLWAYTLFTYDIFLSYVFPLLLISR